MTNDHKYHPPRWATRFLYWYCPPVLLEEIEGDLYENFYRNLEEKDIRIARLRYGIDAIRFCNYTTFKKARKINAPQYHQRKTPIAMWKNYFIIAYRTLLRQAGYSFINITGLSFGMACFVLIALYVLDEFSFDRMHQKADRIYRIVETKKDPELGEQTMGRVAYNVSEGALSNFSEVESAVKILQIGRILLVNPENENSTYEEIQGTEASFLEVFDFPLIEGNRETALSEPNSLVLTEELAHILFGDQSALGKTVTSDWGVTFRVTGVIENFPDNSHLNFRALYSFNTLASNEWYQEMRDTDWSSNSFSTYFLLSEQASADVLATKIEQLVQEHRESNTPASSFYLQPLKDIHFYSGEIESELNWGEANITYIYIFLAIGIFILLIACVNYMNLATARAAKRFKEVGIRKTVGAGKWNLVGQFLAESIFIAFISLLLALLWVFLALPVFNTFIEKSLTFNLVENIWLALGILALAVVVGILSGSYPAFYLSRFKPAFILKGNTQAIKGNFNLRRVLVVFQFTLSIVMIVATLVAVRQMDFIRTKELGYNQHQLVSLDINSGLARRGYETLKTEYGKLPAVESVTVSSRLPGEWKNLPQVEVLAEGREDGSPLQMYFLGIDEDFISTFEMQLLKGNNFTGNPLVDSTAVILNETAAEMLGIENPADQYLEIPAVYFGNRSALEKPFMVRVIGIVKDFHLQSLYNPIAPLVMAYRNNPIHSIDYFTLRITNEDIPGTLESLEEILATVDPSHILEYNFLDERLNQFYRNDQKRERIFGAAAIIAIFIACLGLFALSSFMAGQKTKEIGIRKVFGASLLNITFLLSKEFLILISLAFLIAAPVAYFLMERWLQGFAYRIQIDAGLLAWVAMISFTIALATVSYQVMKAARRNPVDSLRYE